MAGPRTIKSNCGKCIRCTTGITIGTWDAADHALHVETLRQKRISRHQKRKHAKNYKQKPASNRAYSPRNGYKKKV